MLDMNKEFNEIDGILKGHKPKIVEKDFYDLLLNEEIGRVTDEAVGNDISITVKIPMNKLAEIKNAIEAKFGGQVNDMNLLANDVVTNIIWRYFNKESVNPEDFQNNVEVDDIGSRVDEGNKEFKCRNCGTKYDHDMASDEDVGICKWCAGEVEDDGGHTDYASKKKVEEARTIGGKYKQMIRSLITQARNLGMTGVNEIEEYVNMALPEEAFETWESAHDEINRLIHDYVMGTDGEEANEQTLETSGEPTSNIDVTPIKDETTLATANTPSDVDQPRTMKEEYPSLDKASLINASYYENGEYVEDIPLDVRELEGAEVIDADDQLAINLRDEDLGKAVYRVGKNIYAVKGEK